ncbi:recombination protein [Vibrio phage 2.275.O._10N.286.54.E11]|nr:recombination protein [Vibrio phage 2.275.O._10N.286.54.E11]
MVVWHREIQKDKAKILDFVTFFEAELEVAKKEVAIKGNLEKLISSLPGIFEHRFGQLQQVEAVLEQLENEMRKLRSEKFREFLEAYQRQLSSSDAWKYVDGTVEVATHYEFINEVAYIRNQFLSVTKALDQKSFMVGHVVRLRAAGLEDANLD